MREEGTNFNLFYIFGAQVVLPMLMTKNPGEFEPIVADDAN
jgi:hypothetical protein